MCVYPKFVWRYVCMYYATGADECVYICMQIWNLDKDVLVYLDPGASVYVCVPGTSMG